MKCPVCHNPISIESNRCPRCEFDALQQDFISQSDAEYWYHSMVLPYRANWLSTLSGFRISGLCLDKYTGKDTVVVLPFGITRIEDAFRNNKTLTTVVIPESVTVISDCAFQGCENLTTIVLPNSLAEIRTYAFDGCTSLKSVDLPQNLQMICSSAFKDCNSLEEIYIPQSVAWVDDDIFENCSALKMVHVGVETEIHHKKNNTFKGCDTNLQIIRYPHRESEPSIPSFWKNEDEDPLDKFWEEFTPGYGTIIDKYISVHKEVLYENSWFIARGNLISYVGNETEVTIPEGVCSIGNLAFAFSSVEKVIIPSAVKKIYPEAFLRCRKLKEVVLPDELEEISDGMFDGSNLDIIVLPSSIRRIGYEAFQHTHINSLTIPESVREIGEAAFRWCASLETIRLPDEIKVLHAETFEGCRKLNSVHLPRKLQEIEDGVFWSCQNLCEINIPETVTTIGYHAFMGCKSLETVYIPESVEFIGSQAFEGCINLKRVIAPKHLSYIARVVRVRFKDCHEDLTIKFY